MITIQFILLSNIQWEFTFGHERDLTDFLWDDDEQEEEVDIEHDEVDEHDELYIVKMIHLLSEAIV